MSATQAVPAKTPRTSRTRQPVKALNKSPAEIARDAQAEKDRKAASRKTLREAKKAEKEAAKAASQPEPPKPATPAPSLGEQIAKHDAEKAAFRAALEIDARAELGDDASPEAVAKYVAEQMEVPEDKHRYSGPMLALVHARKSYVAAANGVLCNGDAFAIFVGRYTREQVVTSLGKMLHAKGLIASPNPYAALNPGQQSMNLRNKTRHHLKNGDIKTADLEAAFAGWKPLDTKKTEA